MTFVLIFGEKLKKLLYDHLPLQHCCSATYRQNIIGFSDRCMSHLNLFAITRLSYYVISPNFTEIELIGN